MPFRAQKKIKKADRPPILRGAFSLLGQRAFRPLCSAAQLMSTPPESILGPIPEPAIALLPKKLAISSSHRHGLKYSVQLKKGPLTYTYWPIQDSSAHKPKPQRRQIKPSAKQWKAFRKKLDQLNVWCWQNYYPSPP